MIPELTEDLFRREGARILAVMIAHLGIHRLQLAEDVVQEALVKALQTWPYRGIPDNPGAWLTQTAKNLALDVLRREQRWTQKESNIAAEQERWLSSSDASPPDETFADDTLRLMFVCFHPQLSPEAQVALALRTVCGMSAAEIGAAYLTSEAAVAKRLVRARQRIRDLALPFAVPEPKDLPERLDGVLRTLYLLFNEGYKASAGDRLVREELCHEAIRLAAILCQHPHTQFPRVFALHSLMCLNASRLAARTDALGSILRLHEQDRSLWDHRLIQRGIHSLAAATTGTEVSDYHLEAGISACHCLTSPDAATDWPRILSLYDQLIRINGSPIVAMNRAVAVAQVHGPAQGIAALDAIRDRSTLEAYHLYHVIRAALTAESGDTASAIRHYQEADRLATLASEKTFIAKRLAELASEK